MTIDLRLGDCLDVMRTMPDGSVHCCVTSPPYFGLRDYGVAGQIGLEPTPDAYVARMVDVFREVRRVLRDDGTLWLNLGDSYAASGQSGKQNLDVYARDVRGQKDNGPKSDARVHGRAPTCDGLKTKDLIGIPWRVAFALQADGWYLRSDIIWHKPNPMPESVRDRPTKAHEYLFLLSKSATYHYDADAVREPNQLASTGWAKCPSKAKVIGNGETSQRSAPSVTHRMGSIENGRNRRSVWTVATRPFKGAHFATFPPKLIDPCILAGTSEAGCCPACGKPWERVVERERSGGGKVCPGDAEAWSSRRNGQGRSLGDDPVNTSGLHSQYFTHKTVTLGFRPACSCDAGPAVPCTVLDPFSGAGTTGVVAVEHGRSYTGIEINPDYLAMSGDRINAVPTEAARPCPRSA